ARVPSRVRHDQRRERERTVQPRRRCDVHLHRQQRGELVHEPRNRQQLMQSDIEKACTIDGWLTDGEASALHRLAAEASGPVVEIGSWRGRSTAALALGSMSGSKQPVYAVDDFKGVPPCDRPTANGECPGWESSSPEIL